MKVVFLDIDGVLNSHRTAIAFSGVSWSGADGIRAKMDEVAIRLIGGIVRASGAVVILSSSWRNDSNWTSIGPALGLPIAGRTPSGMGPRGQEIADWLAKNPGVEQYAIIDDDSDMLPEQLPFFVHTHYSNGFMFEHAEKLADLLGISIYDVNHPAQRLPEPTKGLDWSGE
nr:HAD domain-containing protein [uncultured Rhodoferax sp.]